MKRSEGVSLIIKILSEFDMLHPNGFSYAMLSKYILKRMEEEGFKPPYNGKGLTSYDIAMGANVNQWEEE